MSDLAQDLGRVEGKLDQVADNLSALIQRLDRRDARVDARLTSVERKQYAFSGVAMVAGWFLARVDLTQLLSIFMTHSA